VPRRRPGRAKGSASFADLEHKLPIAVDGESDDGRVEREIMEVA
jgi:hypothetical protein